MNQVANEKGNAVSQSVAQVMKSVELHESMSAPHFKYDFQCLGPVEAFRNRYVELRDQIAQLSLLGKGYDAQEAEFLSIPMEDKWTDQFENTVLTAGKNDLLDKYFAGSAYTAAWFMGIISSASFSAISATDTSASHAGWLEAGGANAPTISNSTRPAPSFSAASAGSKATSSAVVFNITGTGTIEGAFTSTLSTIGGTTGIMYSAGLFTGGTRAVLNGDTVNVSLTLSL